METLLIEKLFTTTFKIQTVVVNTCKPRGQIIESHERVAKSSVVASLFLYWLPFLLLFLLAISAAQAREKTVRLTLTIRQAPPKPVTLSFLVRGIETEGIKSEIDKTGRYQFNFRYRPGFYRLTYGTREWSLTFPLLTEEAKITKINLKTSGTAPLEDVEAEGAPELNLYFEARRSYEAYQEARWGLDALARTGLSKEQVQELRNENQEFYEECINSLSLRADSAQSAVMQQILRLFIRPHDNKATNWWDEPLLSTPLVATAPEFDSYIRDFLQTRHADTLTYWQQIQAYAEAIHEIAEVPCEPRNVLMLRNALDFIVQGTAYDVLLDSIAKYYPNAGEDALYQRNTERKTERLVKLRGTRLDDNRSFIVSKETEYTLLIVWSVWCAHCQEILPALVRLCEKLPKELISVRAICIDSDTPAVRHFIESRIWPWENILEPDDGESNILMYLQADGTPEFFLLNQKGNLLSRPEDVKRLEREILWLQIASQLQGKLY